MGVSKTAFRYGCMAAVLLSFLIPGGCGGKAVKYSYVTKTGVQELKNYQWGNAHGLYVQDPLLEANVQFLVDRGLEQKGLRKSTGKADLLVWISYEYDANSYKLQTLNLNISKAGNNELVWRGTAVGNIRTDGTSGDLKKVVEGILANFPPK